MVETPAQERRQSTDKEYQMPSSTCTLVTSRGQKGGVPGELSYDARSDQWRFVPKKRPLRMSALPETWRGEPTLDTMSVGNAHVVFDGSKAFRFGPPNGRKAKMLVETWRQNRR